MDDKTSVLVLDPTKFGEGKDLTDFINAGGQLDSCLIEPVEPPKNQSGSMYRFEPYDGELKAYDWVIDDFLYVGFHTFAGPRGIGKTTIQVYLACVAAGLFETDELKTVQWRPVIMVTEDTDQAKRILYGIQQKYHLTAEQIDSRFKLTSARRAKKVDIDTLESQSRNLIRKVGNQQIYPLIIFDTFAANFDLYSENDNQAISDFVSLLRQNFKNYPLIISTHTAKSDYFVEPEKQTARGGGALESDAQGAFVVARMANNDVFITPTKRRDTGAIPEIGITLSSHELSVKDRWGNDQIIRYHTGQLYVTSRQHRDEIAEASKTTEQIQTSQEIKEELRPYLEDGPVSTRRAQQIVRDADIKASNRIINEALEALKQSIEYQKQTEGY